MLFLILVRINIIIFFFFFRNGSFFGRMFQQISFIMRRDSAIAYSDVSDKVLASER